MLSTHSNSYVLGKPFALGYSFFDPLPISWNEHVLFVRVHLLYLPKEVLLLLCSELLFLPMQKCEQIQGEENIF